MAERAPSTSGPRAVGIILLVVLTVVVLVVALKLRSTRTEVIHTRTQVTELEETVKTLRTRTEQLVRERSQALIEKEEERALAEDLGRKLTEASARLERARADLARVGGERDEHLAARLDLETRLEAALSELAK
ncbi:MAG: hypothetical protein ACYTDY_19995 [Planctomycetota bacterium]|jgi:predicted Holliday junction resolvase-like endonuclease